MILNRAVCRLNMSERVWNNDRLRSTNSFFSKTKQCFLLKNRKFQGQTKEVQNTIFILHVTHISVFVWFQSRCSSVKSVSIFSSIDIKHDILRLFESTTDKIRLTWLHLVITLNSRSYFYTYTSLWKYLDFNLILIQFTCLFSLVSCDIPRNLQNILGS